MSCLSAAPVASHIVRHRHGIPQYMVGHPDRLARIEKRLEKLPGLVLAGNSYRGISMNACIKDAEAVSERLIGRLTHTAMPK